jgi:hypothetical protein
MNISNPVLWSRISSFKIGCDDDAISFKSRLARENGWSFIYTDSCIKEYKKFIYLAAISKQPITPSNQIDQTWHLHLTYTRSYWIQLCEETLNEVIHHDPTRGGSSELLKYREQYGNTLDLYEKEFGEAPRKDIWPENNALFLGIEQHGMVNSKRNWMIRNPMTYAVLLVFSASPLVAVGEVQGDPFSIKHIALIIFCGFSIFAISLLIIRNWIKSIGGGKNKGFKCGSGGSCGG